MPGENDAIAIIRYNDDELDERIAEQLAPPGGEMNEFSKFCKDVLRTVRQSDHIEHLRSNETYQVHRGFYLVFILHERVPIDVRFKGFIACETLISGLQEDLPQNIVDTQDFARCVTTLRRFADMYDCETQLPWVFWDPAHGCIRAYITDEA